MHSISRRRFLVSAAALAACKAVAADTASATQEAGRLRARPGKPHEHAGGGLHLLRIGGTRDGFYSVPDTYAESSPAPLLILLHGATQRASMFATPYMDAVIAKRGVIVLAPDSRDYTWDISRGGFGPDVAFIDRALGVVFDRCAIDPAKIAIGGFSDGATYALSLGATNGDFFSRLIAFSPGYYSPATRRGHPGIFISHGTRDQILPIDRTSRRIVPELRTQRYDVKYVEFDGPHAVTPDLVEQALTWWLGAGT